MSSRSLNKVQLIGNLTRDPELRYTPTGAAVCTIGLATNRMWTTESGEKKEETEFHRVVAWNKLAELCSQLLTKGRKIYVEGRLRTNTWQGQDGSQRSTTEVVIEDMIILDSRRATAEGEAPEAEVARATTVAQPAVKPAPARKKAESEEPKKETSVTEDINPDDIPF
jgi:single-strand DNA-binding protein